ncbi:hypothetical protein [Methylophilus aquaticus]|uniref:Uncharacterized protein n=1 Tax=Methylophilus aquaticus TaxID=1971610 RepID=A0ABT9JSQ2_9PROT|nr:hypothetical protein [Methylophilus aquaticus]MDP8567616.1 hypothetical protein [Methylophilus aquaticus]
MANNLFVLPRLGQTIQQDDLGVYYILNQQTGRVRSLIQLVRENLHWYLLQLQPIADGLDYRWSVMAREQDCDLRPVSDKQIAHYFSRPEYSEPVGAWQVLRNHEFGFAKFTPMSSPDEVSYAILTFDGEEMKRPIRLHKAPAEWLEDESAAEQLLPRAEFA